MGRETEEKEKSQTIIVYGTNWCPDCHRSIKLLGEKGKSYRWVDIEQDVAAKTYVEEVNHGKRIVPTIVFPEGDILVEPSDAELANRLDEQARAGQDL